MNDIEINSSEKFAVEINKISREKGINIIESIISYCEDHLLDIEDILPLLDRSMKDRIKVSAIENRYVVGQSCGMLPI